MVARVLGLAETQLREFLPGLLARNIPPPDPTTGNFDLKAVAAWQDRRWSLGTVADELALDASDVVSARLAEQRRG